MRRPIITSYVLLGLLFLLSLMRQNWEFVIYASVLVPVVILIHWSDKRFAYLDIALWGFALWTLLHLLGGLASVGGTRLYDLVLVPLVGAPYSILKYDQVLHFYTYVVIAGLLGSVVKAVVAPRASRFTVGVVLVLAATGVGAVNEILEFLPVVLFDSPGPGGYINTALDLVMNFLGSILGSWLFLRR